LQNIGTTNKMKWNKDYLEISTHGKGLYPFTSPVSGLIQEWGVQQGMCYLYMPHTSASLVISESYDPTAKIDMEEFMERMVPENQPWFRLAGVVSLRTPLQPPPAESFNPLSGDRLTAICYLNKKGERLRTSRQYLN
jgi:hypothetical protein